MWAPSPACEAATTRTTSTQPQTASADRLEVDERMRFRHKTNTTFSPKPLLTQTKHDLNKRRSTTAETKHNLNRQRCARVVWYCTIHGPPPFPLHPFRYLRRDALKIVERPGQAKMWAPPVYTHTPAFLSPTAQVPLVGGQQGYCEGDLTTSPQADMLTRTRRSSGGDQ